MRLANSQTLATQRNSDCSSNFIQVFSGEVPMPFTFINSGERQHEELWWCFSWVIESNASYLDINCRMLTLQNGFILHVVLRINEIELWYSPLMPSLLILSAEQGMIVASPKIWPDMTANLGPVPDGASLLGTVRHQDVYSWETQAYVYQCIRA